MKVLYLLLVPLLPGLVEGAEVVVKSEIESKPPIHWMLPTHKDVSSQIQTKSPPPPDSIHWVCDSFGIDYGGEWSSPLNYPNGDHIVRRLGHYDVPCIFVEGGPKWNRGCCVYCWNDSLGCWQPEFVTPTGPEDTLDTGRISAAADTFGDIHVVWHGPAPTTGQYEVWYRNKTGGTWGPVVLVSMDEGIPDGFPVVTVDGGSGVTAVWIHGDIGLEEDLYARRSTDCGETWGPIENITNFGGIMFGSWILPSIDYDLGTGDVHVVCNTDMNSDNKMDIVYIRYDAASGGWDPPETVATAEGSHPLACPQVVVDSENVPHVVYQENLAREGPRPLCGWPQCGPAGRLWYTYKEGGSWATPHAIFSTPTGWATGYPDLGIDPDGYLYLVYTQPAYCDGEAFYYGFPWASFNVYYSVKAPESTEWTPREMVSRVQDPYINTSCIYPQTNKDVPADGPDIAWAQLVESAPPSFILYNHETPGLPPAGDVAVEWTWPDRETWEDIEVGDTVFPKAVFRCVSWGKQRTDYFMDSRFEVWLGDSLLFDWQRPIPDLPPGSSSDTVECGFGVAITDSSTLDSLRIRICAIKANDTDPSNDCVEVPGVYIEEEIQHLSRNSLLQNRPNPFTQSTTINFSITRDEKVTLEIFDSAGRLVRKLIDRRLSKGSYSIRWDGKNDLQEHVSSGVYFYRLKTSENFFTKKMLLLN